MVEIKDFGAAFRREFKDAYAKENAGQATGEVGRVLKETRARFIQKLMSKYRRGDIIARAISDFTDIFLLEIAKQAVPSSLQGQVCVLATGGYGRGMLAPYSDVDLLVLHKDLDQGALKSIVEKLLYPLWDAGIVVGQAVHTPKSALAFAGEDLNMQTSLLDARLLFGDRSIFDDFQNGYDKFRVRTKKKFIAKKLEEQQARHDLSMQSRFLVEPNLKEGKGALRDIHSVEWINKAHSGHDVAHRDGGLLDRDEILALQKTERFLWTLRVFMHDIRGRADEKLKFDLQPVLAERLNYADRAHMNAAERMMKHYFLNASEIGRITRLFIARLEEKNTKLVQRAPQFLPKALTKDELGGEINLKLSIGRLDFKNPARARKHPEDLFRIFRAFAKKPSYDFHPDALTLISECVPAITKNVRRRADISRLFVASLTTAKNPVKLLRVMSETGLLGKYIPSIGKVRGRIEYGLYRRFTVDEHIFHSIGILAALRAGHMAGSHPIASEIVQSVKNPSLYYLAVLLHEAGFALRDGDIEATTRLVARISKRLGLNDTSTDLVSWCAARRHFMVEIAERRNMGDPQVISNFASICQSKERLDLMLVLSLCHLRAIGDHAWGDWTRRQMTSLYEGARAWLAGGDAGLAAWFSLRKDTVREKISPLIADWPSAAREAFFATISSEMASTLTAATIARVASLSQKVRLSDDQAGVATTIFEGALEAIVIAPDRRGLLSDLAGAVAASGASVRNVHAVAFGDGRIVDVFSIRAIDVEINEDLAARVQSALLEAARPGDKSRSNPQKRFGDRRHIFTVAAKVSVDTQISAECLVVEAEGRDRPGLLHKLAAELADLGVIIRSAHAATYGERAVDTFYLQDAPGYKIVDKRRIQSIKRRLLSLLRGG